MIDAPPFAAPAPLLFPDVDVEIHARPDGEVILTNRLQSPSVTIGLPQRLAEWAVRAPDRTFLSEGVAKERRTLTYAQAQAAVCEAARALQAMSLSSDRPLMLIGPNSINQAVTLLAAMTIGVPAAVVSPAYVAATARPWAKFLGVADQVSPGLIIADAPEGVHQALAGSSMEATPVRSLRDLQWLSEGSIAATGDPAAFPDPDLDAPAKLLFTSGSTGVPKAVINTQRMMVSNMLALGTVWPFLQTRPPILVDWLPWNHTFGGNFCFNLALWFGGSLHIDAGRPDPEGVGLTVEALRQSPPTIYFNVPAGFDALLPALERDPDFAGRFFERLDVLFNAGAGLPASLRERLDAASKRARGRSTPMLGAWGATETAPCSTILYFHTRHAANLGAPMPGVSIKLAPVDGKLELRVKGPNVTPGYWRSPDPTAAMFDADGYYRSGDAGRLVDPMAPEAGILFGGRLAENFKLLSGTWVNAGQLRLAVVAATTPLVSDVVVAGEGRHELGLLVFVNAEACRRRLVEALGDDGAQADPRTHPLIRQKIATSLCAFNAGRHGSSTRIARFAVMAEPPNPGCGEITEKGYLNQRAVLEHRSGLVEDLYLGPPLSA